MFQRGIKDQTVPVPSTDPQYRVQKGDGAYLAQVLREKGFQVHPKGERINVFDSNTREYICGFTWNKATGDLPGRWHFDMNIADVFSLTDLKAILSTIQRQRTLRDHARKAWIAFQETKSDKRWGVYLGILVAMFHNPRPTTQEPESDD